jgi:PAS domain S-box-containing protein
MIDKFYLNISKEIVHLEKKEDLISQMAKSIVIEYGFDDCLLIDVHDFKQPQCSCVFVHPEFNGSLEHNIELAHVYKCQLENSILVKLFWPKKSKDKSRSYCVLPLYRDENCNIALVFRSTHFIYLSSIKRSILINLAALASTLLGKLKDLELINEDVYNLKQQHYALNSSAIVAFTDETGKITNVNDKFTEIAGYSRDELIGKDHRVINSGHHPKEFFANLWMTISSGQIWRGEVKNKRKDGGYYWVDSTIIPIKDTRGKITGYIAIRYDVTHRKDVEFSLTNALSESAFYKSAIDQSAIVAMTDKYGVINYVNDFFCRISGYSRQELIGKDHRILNSGRMPPNFFKEMWSEIKAGRVWRGEVCNKAKDGHFYWVDTVVIPFMDQNGQPEKFIAIRSDITQRKLSEEQLVAAKEEALNAAQVKAEFLANMSHEIRTPMNGIIGMTNLLLMSEIDDQTKNKLTTIQRCGETLLGILNDVLDLSKLEARKSELESIAFNLNETILDTISIFDTKAQEKNLSLNFSTNLDPSLWVKGDQTKFKQILTNLVSNAIKFTPSGFVKIHLNKSNNYFQIQVVDSGIGMDDYTLKRLFHSFSQADASTTRKYGGTGLGLAISKGLAELMSGTIDVNSHSGEGTTFTLKIPFTEIHAPHSDSTLTDLNYQFATKNPLNIMIADDNEVNLDVLNQFLIKLGYHPVLARDGSEVLDLLTTQDFDCLILDCHMPKIDGFETTKRIRNLESGRNPYIIALTASTFKNDQELCFQTGMDYFLGKPLLFDKLYECLCYFGEYKMRETNSLIDTAIVRRNYPKLQDRNSFWLMLKNHLLPTMNELIQLMFSSKGKEFKMKLHSFKGMVSTVCVISVINQIKKIESLDLSGDYELVFREMALLRRMILNLNNEIQDQYLTLEAS